ncbi:hypothetical protein P4S64_15280 [Vibrio sp. M60_M31a]
MNKEARMRLWLEIELQKALQQNGLEVWYQPKVNARDFRYQRCRSTGALETPCRRLY